jgi:hypothetical protein
MSIAGGVRRRGLGAVAAAIALAALGAMPASADPPPAAAGTTSHGFLARGGVLTTIDHPRATTVPASPGGRAGTATTGINDRGETLGLYERRDGAVRHFIRDRQGRFGRIDEARSLPPGRTDELIDINNRGEIVGFYNDENGATTTGFLRTTKGRFVDVKVPGSVVTGPLKINDRRQVVGLYVDAAGRAHGFVWDHGDYRTIDVPGAAATFVLGINNHGQIVGSSIDAAGAYHGFLRDRQGVVTILPDAPGAVPAMGGTQPSAVNDRGQIVGVAYTADGGSRGFLLERGRFRMIEAPRATYTRALDIDNRGHVVGDYGTPNRVASMSVSPADRISNGGAGKDNLFGWGGDDDLRGSHDNDRLFGMDGADTLNGDAGSDNLDGGAGGYDPPRRRKR